jgi:hypothetical protein
VDDDGAADDAVGLVLADRDVAHGEVDPGHAFLVDVDVAQVAGVLDRVVGAAVLHLVGIEVAAGVHGLVVAAVALLVDVHGFRALGVAGDLSGHPHQVSDLRELDVTGHVRPAARLEQRHRGRFLFLRPGAARDEQRSTNSCQYLLLHGRLLG